MPKSLPEYIDWLDERDLRWPAPPRLDPAKATPYLKPLAGIRAVTWSIYGTLLRIADGELLFETPQQIRMEVALDKTIQEFNMWQSMSRKPGAPWEYMLQQYRHVLEEQRLTGARQKGDVPEVDSAVVWRKLLGRLEQKEYSYDASFYGDLDELSAKVAYFFHASLQGVEAAPDALAALQSVPRSGVRQGLLADAQPFTVPQLLRCLRSQGTVTGLGDLFSSELVTLSWQEGVRTPSKSLFRAALARFEQAGIAPAEVLHVGSRLRDDLGVAKSLGMRTALYAADKVALCATAEDVRNPELKPDRLLTGLLQIRDILAGS